MKMNQRIREKKERSGEGEEGFSESERTGETGNGKIESETVRMLRNRIVMSVINAEEHATYDGLWDDRGGDRTNADYLRVLQP